MPARQIFSTLVLLVVFLLLTSIACVHFSKRAVIAGLEQAFETGNAATIVERVDFPALQEFLKRDLGERSAAAQAGGVLAGRIPLRPENVPGIVDYYVRPDNIAILTAYKRALFPSTPPSAFILGDRFTGPLRFAVTVGYPPGVPPEGGAIPPMADSMRVRIVFGLDGMTWKIKETHFPLFLVPAHTYSLPAAQMFLPQE